MSREDSRCVFGKCQCVCKDLEEEEEEEDQAENISVRRQRKRDGVKKFTVKNTAAAAVRAAEYNNKTGSRKCSLRLICWKQQFLSIVALTVCVREFVRLKRENRRRNKNPRQMTSLHRMSR